MNFIGVDLHKKSITVCVMDEKRRVLARKTLACTQTDEILEFFRQFRPFKVVVEATAPLSERAVRLTSRCPSAHRDSHDPRAIRLPFWFPSRPFLGQLPVLLSHL